MRLASTGHAKRKGLAGVLSPGCFYNPAMSGSTITTGEINTLMNAAVTALGAGDFDIAYTRALQAQGLMLAKPRSNFDRDELEWAPEKIDAFLDRVQILKGSVTSASRGKIVQIPVRRTYSGLDEYQ